MSRDRAIALPPGAWQQSETLSQKKRTERKKEGRRKSEERKEGMKEGGKKEKEKMAGEDG